MVWPIAISLLIAARPSTSDTGAPRGPDIKDNVEVVEGNGGLTKVVLKHACGSQAEVRSVLC